MQKVVVWWWNRGGSVNTTYVVSVLHMLCIIYLMQKGQCLAVSQVEQGRECEYQRNHVCCQCVAHWCEIF